MRQSGLPLPERCFCQTFNADKRAKISFTYAGIRANLGTNEDTALFNLQLGSRRR
jgi:hypothetical protein